jgi:hypothetical protein
MIEILISGNCARLRLHPADNRSATIAGLTQLHKGY